jgi:hypothetical protein
MARNPEYFGTADPAAEQQREEERGEEEVAAASSAQGHDRPQMIFVDHSKEAGGGSSSSSPAAAWDGMLPDGWDPVGAGGCQGCARKYLARVFIGENISPQHGKGWFFERWLSDDVFVLLERWQAV